MERIKYLLLRFLREEATPAEQAELEAWAAEAPANRDLIQELQDPAQVAEALANLDSLHREEAWERVSDHADAHRPAAVVTLDPERRLRRPGILRWTVAAAFLSLLGMGAWWVIRNLKTQAPMAVAAKPADIPTPTGSRATLTLASGQTVYLDSAGSGAIAQQGNIQVVKGVGGRLAYAPEGRLAVPGPSDLIYNTVTNPRGSEVVDLTLSDGTRIWLNAESSVRYPVVFLGVDRTVEMTGEAYFEVAKNAHQPFVVQEKGMTIRVLGTSFNVNGYDDEPVSKTTLVEGKVNVDYGKVGALLQPGMQAEVYRGSNPDNQVPRVKVGPANVVQALAWKNGLFAFSDADLPTVMRQLSRWYNVDVKYEGEIPKDKYQFNGKIGKTLTLDQVLKILTKTQVHYLIDGNELTIRP